MNILYIVIASILVLVGFVLSLVGISGTWIVLITATGLDLLLDGSWDYFIVSIVFLVACILVELIEFGSGLLGAKALGGSKYSQVGAFLGTVTGGIVGSFLIPIPVVGTLAGVVLGGFLGAIVGELIFQRKSADSYGAAVKLGLKAGLGAMLARLLTIALKAAVSTAMVIWYVIVIVEHALR